MKDVENHPELVPRCGETGGAVTFTWPEAFTTLLAFTALLWNVVNEIRLREHAKTLQVSEAHLRVRAEMQLRLHQHAWELLRETQAAAFDVFEAVREYQVQALAAQRGAATVADTIFGSPYKGAQTRLQKFVGLAHVTPPERQDLRDAASAFSKAFNQINRSMLGEPEAANVESTMTAIDNAIDNALALAVLGTKTWNEQLWHHQTVNELVPEAKASTA